MKAIKERKTVRYAHVHKVVYSKASVDEQCAALALSGMAVSAIALRLNLSIGQVYYRVCKAGFRTADWRYGSSDFAQVVLGLVVQEATQHVRQQIAPRFLAYSQERHR